MNRNLLKLNIDMMKRTTFCAAWMALLLLLSPATSVAQHRVGTQEKPLTPTPIGDRERSIEDLLYFPFTCINAYMPTREIAWQEVTDAFGTCESMNMSPGLHASEAFDFTYRGVRIGFCYYAWYDDRTWYGFFFDTKSEADQFYDNLVKDIQGTGIPLTKDKVYGGMSNRKVPTAVFKWINVDTPVKVKEPGPSNIETADVVGKYKVELGVMKNKKNER